MTAYAQHFSTLQTPQSEAASPNQVKNDAGGYSFRADPLELLRRFLILGAEGGTYYSTEKKLTVESAKNFVALLDGPLWKEALDLVGEVSDSGRAPKNDAAVFLLAVACGRGRSNFVRDRALREVFPRVVRTGTHLFQFCEAVEQFRGWGRGLKRAVARWYESKTPEALGHQLVKYRQRGGWSHRDVLRLCNPSGGEGRDACYRWAVKGAGGMGPREVKRGEVAKAYAGHDLPAYLAAFEELRACEKGDLPKALALIEEHGFTHEAVPSELLGDPRVWGALLDRMPPGALVRNLGRMTANGLLSPMSLASRRVQEKLSDAESLRRARLHPANVLRALFQYRAGRGEKGSLTWSPVSQVVDALDAAFYDAFDHVEPSGARSLLALDVSGSMGTGDVAGVPGFSPRAAAACMAMVTARSEKQWQVMGFSHTIVDVPVTPRMRLDQVMDVMSRIPFGATDCSLPMLYARDAGLDVDAFVVYTDSETWAGGCQPQEALSSYREKRGITARSAVVAMTANEFSIADPADPGMMDVVGFDTGAPAALAEFFRVR